MRRIILGLITLTSLLVATSASGFGFSDDLKAAPVNPTQCSQSHFLSQLQSVRVTAAGFAPNISVDVMFECCGDAPQLLANVTSNGTGAIDTVVVLPSFTPPQPNVAIPSEIRARAVVPANGESRGFFMVGPVGGGGDTDLDTVPDDCDNCVSISNVSQPDSDADGLGDHCDACQNDAENDFDGDGICGDVDICPFDPNNDIDADGICGGFDNCPDDNNPNQEDSDSNGIGDACQVNPTCSDGTDNDSDGRTDFPQDKGCSSAVDSTETDPNIPCDDGIDNDGDGRRDFRPDLLGDRGCGYDTGSTTLPENPACNDGIDNDGDGQVDWDGKSGVFPPDVECQGFGFGPSEVLPEPSVAVGLGLGVLSLCFRRRRISNR